MVNLINSSAVLRCYLLSRFPEIDISGNEKGNLVRLQPWIVNGAKKQIYQGILFSQFTAIPCLSASMFYPKNNTEWQPFRPPIQGRPRELVLCWGFLSLLSENAHIFTFHWITLIVSLLKSLARKDQERFHHLITVTPCCLRDTDRFVLSRVLRRTRQQICNL